MAEVAFLWGGAWGRLDSRLWCSGFSNASRKSATLSRFPWNRGFSPGASRERVLVALGLLRSMAAVINDDSVLGEPFGVAVDLSRDCPFLPCFDRDFGSFGDGGGGDITNFGVKGGGWVDAGRVWGRSVGEMAESVSSRKYQGLPVGVCLLPASLAALPKPLNVSREAASGQPELATPSSSLRFWMCGSSSTDNIQFCASPPRVQAKAAALRDGVGLRGAAVAGRIEDSDAFRTAACRVGRLVVGEMD